MNIYKTIKHFLHVLFSGAGYKILCALSCFMVLWGCATVPKESDILAIVDGEPITINDLEYSVQVSHRRDGLSSTGQVKISQYMQRLIDDRLIVQEARRMGMEDYPEVQRKIKAFILRGSVNRLYNDEIVQKVSVSEEEIKERFRHDYELFTLGLIRTATKEDAASVIGRLKNGEDFNKVAREYSVDYEKEGAEKTVKRKDLAPVFKNVVLNLKTGEISDIINVRESFFIVKLIKREEAAEKEYEVFSKGIEKQIRKLKIDKRSVEYLAELRSRADIDIDREILDSIKIDDQKHGLKKWLKDYRILVKLNNRVIRVGEFASKLSAARIDQKEKILNNLIDNKLVDYEALSRKYETKPDLGGRLQRYKAPVLKNIFIEKMIVPGIMVSEEELEDYYIKHKEEFIKPSRYRIQQISVKNIKDIQSIMNSLEGGANFSWLAKKRSKDSFATTGGTAGWKTKENLSAPAAEIIDTLEPGDFSPILEIEDYFRIIRLLEKGEIEFQDFNNVKNVIHRRIFTEKYNKVYNEYVERLKKGVQIKVFDESVEAFEKTFRK